MSEHIYHAFYPSVGAAFLMYVLLRLLGAFSQ